MAGEEPRYSNWVRQQPCAACLGPGPCDPHHAQSGTTYDPDEPVPAKSAGPRRGRGQRSHDKWLIPLHFSCHGEFTDHRGHFRGWTQQQRAQWEHDQVRIHRQRYAMQCPEPIAPAVTSSRATRRRAGQGWTVTTVLSWLRKEAPTRPGPVAAALNELAELIEKDTL